jgi:hypothetical protein
VAGELFVRVVENDPNPDDDLLQLAGKRAQAILAELQTAAGVPAERLQTADAQPLADEAGVSAKLSLDAMAAGS